MDLTEVLRAPRRAHGLEQPNLGDDAVRQLAKQFSLDDGVAESPPINVAVLVPSTTPQARVWRRLADRIHYVDNLERGVAEMQDSHVGLVVLVNRYNGIDVPCAACELLIIDEHPAPAMAVDRRKAAALIETAPPGAPATCNA